MNVTKHKLTIISKIIICFFVLFGVLETWWFGWNKTPINQYEEICDLITKYGIQIGVILYLVPILNWLEIQINKNHEQ